MRENLFRGRQTDNGEWIEGFYCPVCFGYFPCRPAIVPKEEMNNGCWRPVEVDPETVGQFTGLTDKNGKKIFEGDIIHSIYANCPKNEHIEKITFFDGCFTAESARGGCFARVAGQGSPKHFAFDKSVYMIECEVIGNIHDNPELLKEGEIE